MNDKIIDIKTILLAEDDPGDVELTLAALEENHLANKVVVVNNGEEALDYLYRRGKFKMRATRQSHCRVARQQDAEGQRAGSVEDHQGR